MNKRCFLLVLGMIVHAWVAIAADGRFPGEIEGLPICMPAENRTLYEVKVPESARGHKKDYVRFLRGELIYSHTPEGGSETIQVVMPISQLENPLEGTFNLSQFEDAELGNVGQSLTISTDYRKEIRKRMPGDDFEKVEVWITPRSSVEGDLATTAQHFRRIVKNWHPDIPVGLFFTVGGWPLDWMDHLKKEEFGSCFFK